MTQRRLALVSTTALMLAGLVLLAQPPASAHNYFSFLDSYAGFTGESTEPRPMPPATDAEVDRLLQQLKDGNESIRMIAAGALGQTRSPRAVQPLIGALKDRATFVPPVAALSLGMLKDKSAVEPLKKLAASEDPDGDFGRLYAWQALEMLGVRAVNPMMIDPMMRDDPTMRPVIDALSVGDRPGAVKALLKTFKGDNGEGSEYQQSRLLEEIVDASCLDVLLDVLKTDSEPARCMAACMLAGMDSTPAADVLLHIAADRSSKSRDRAIRCLAATGDPRAVDALTALLKDPKEEVRSDAVCALGDIDDPKVVPILISVVSNRKDPVWESACHVLAERKEIGAVDALIAMLKDKDLYYAGMAAETLGRIGDPRAVEPLISALNRKDDREGQLRPSATQALTDLGDPRAVQLIVTAYAKYPESAAGLLQRIKHPSAAKALFALLSGSKAPSEELQFTVTEALAFQGDAAIEPAVAVLKSTDPAVRAAAVRIFTRQKDPRSVPALISALSDKNAAVRADAALALGRQDDKQTVAKLQSALKDASAKVRANSALALGLLGNADAVQILTQALADKIPQVRAYAGLALCELGDARGFPHALKLLKSDAGMDPAPANVLVRVARACGKMKDKRAIGPIINLLSDYLSGINMSVFDGEPDQSLIDAPVEALTAITGQDFGHAYYRWFAWGYAEGHTKPRVEREDDSYEE